MSHLFVLVRMTAHINIRGRKQIRHSSSRALQYIAILYRYYKTKRGEAQHFFITCLCLERSERNGKKYESLVKRRGKKRAIIAIARMILTAIYQMLSTGEQWNPSDLYKIDVPEALIEKQKAKAIKQAKKLLQREGLLPPDEPVAS